VQLHGAHRDVAGAGTADNIDDADLASAAAEVTAVAKTGAADVLAQRTDVSALEQVQALKEAAFERFGEA
jgi:NAD(P)-dependent dehydrogenase (short-subunit alcohol dehydrogenase family)